jgi:glucose/arabinose dehydrogenase
MQRLFIFLSLFFSLAANAQTPQFRLINWAGNFDRPVDIAHCGDSRLFVVEQQGFIWILDSTGAKSAQRFLDIDARVNSNGSERGLLGLAFHPNYAQNGYFYVNYTRGDGDTRVSRFSVNSANPNAADPSSEVIVLEFDQPFSNHNGGGIKFGPDGYLYIGTGDGGSGGDPLDAGQTRNTLLGKFLRIDVDKITAGVPYGIPADNPFVSNTAYRPEIWSTGWRNPWRFSFDRLTGDLWAGDVGQNAREEIDFEPANTPGRNYGWRCREGNQSYNANGCQTAAGVYTEPVFTYANPGQGCSVTGGYRYRGAVYPDLYGKYICTDYCSGRWWMLTAQPDGRFSSAQVADVTNGEFSSLGEDNKGELYAAGYGTGRIYKIAYGQSVSVVTPSDVTTCVVAPNPSQGQFTLQLDLTAAQEIKLHITDTQGKTVLQQTHTGQHFNLPLETTRLAKGVYYLNVLTQKGQLVRPLVKL